MLACITPSAPPGFRTDLLTQESATYATPSIADHTDRHAERVQSYESMNSDPAGDPAKLARAMVTISSQEQPRTASLPAPTPSAPPSKSNGPARVGERLPRPDNFPRTRRCTAVRAHADGQLDSYSLNARPVGLLCQSGIVEPTARLTNQRIARHDRYTTRLDLGSSLSLVTTPVGSPARRILVASTQISRPQSIRTCRPRRLSRAACARAVSHRPSATDQHPNRLSRWRSCHCRPPCWSWPSGRVLGS